MSSVLLTLFSELADPRRGQGKTYPLAPILLFTVLAMLAGARSYRQVHAFMQTHLDRLNSEFGLPFKHWFDGVPGAMSGQCGLECQRRWKNQPNCGAKVCQFWWGRGGSGNSDRAIGGFPA